MNRKKRNVIVIEGIIQSMDVTDHGAAAEVDGTWMDNCDLNSNMHWRHFAILV
jgi:hypothetical protein